MLHEFSTCLSVVRIVPSQLKLLTLTTAVVTFPPAGSTVKAKRPNLVCAFQSPDIGELPVCTSLVEGVGGIPGMALRMEPAPQASDRIEASPKGRMNSGRFDECIAALLPDGDRS